MNDDRLDRLLSHLENARISKPVLRLLSHLRHYRVKPVKSDGPQWAALCPICDRRAAFGRERSKRHLSVSIKLGNGHALVKCHRGCNTQEILRAIGLELADLFNDPDDIEAWRNRRGPLPVKRMQLEAWLLLEMARGAMSGELAQTVVMEELEAYGIDVSDRYARAVYTSLGGTTRRHHDRLEGGCWVWEVLEPGFPHKSATSAEGEQLPEEPRGAVPRDHPDTRISPPRRRRGAVTEKHKGNSFRPISQETSVHAGSTEGEQIGTTLTSNVNTPTAVGSVDHELFSGERSEPHSQQREHSEPHAVDVDHDGDGEASKAWSDTAGVEREVELRRLEELRSRDDGHYVPGGTFDIVVRADVIPICAGAAPLERCTCTGQFHEKGRDPHCAFATRAPWCERREA